MILVVDNYDSFVHNLARYFQCAGQSDVRIVRNDMLSCAGIRALDPFAIILSPGPCSPDEAGICIDVVQELGSNIPILGVCLGHQAIGQAYGLKTVRAPRPVHGKSSLITHNAQGLFQSLPTPLRVGRYHSLMSMTYDKDALEASGLEVIAQTVGAEGDQTTPMAIKHKKKPVFGVQFHPESILTDGGMDMIENFLEIATRWNAERRSFYEQEAASKQEAVL
jgi:anthranilate synthase/aminodeoxychorismate synthase-like glutamine amidotransferase